MNNLINNVTYDWRNKMGKLYSEYKRRLEGVNFSADEKAKILFQIVKNDKSSRKFHDSEEYEQWCMNEHVKDITWLLQVTYYKKRDRCEHIINAGKGRIPFKDNEFEQLLKEL